MSAPSLSSLSVRLFSLLQGLLASGGDDGTIRVWNTLSGSCEAVLSGHGGPVNGVVFAAAAGQALRLVSASDDTTLRLWELPAGSARPGLQSTRVTQTRGGTRVCKPPAPPRDATWSHRANTLLFRRVRDAERCL